MGTQFSTITQDIKIKLKMKFLIPLLVVLATSDAFFFGIGRKSDSRDANPTVTDTEELARLLGEILVKELRNNNNDDDDHHNNKNHHNKDKNHHNNNNRYNNNTLQGPSVPTPLGQSTTTNTTTTTLQGPSIPTPLGQPLPTALSLSTPTILNLSPSTPTILNLSPSTPMKLNLSPSTPYQLRSSPIATTRQSKNQPITIIKTDE